MFVARMIDNQIENKPNAALMHANEKFVEVLHRAKVTHDGRIVAYVVTIVVVG